LNNQIHFDSNREYMEHVLSIRTHNRGLCILVTPGQMETKASEPDSIARFVDRVKEMLATYS